MNRQDNSGDVANRGASNVESGGELATEIRRGLNQLAILNLLDTESYGYELARRLATRGVAVDEGTLYPSLRRLEKAGLLASRWSTVQGRPRRYYVVTAEGRRVRARLRDVWGDLRGAIDGLVGLDAGDRAPDGGADSAAALAATLAAEREKIGRARDDLLSTVSHELRTPLTLIRTSVGLLLEGDPDLEMRERLLRNIKGSADRMHGLVTDILDLVRLTSGRAELQLRYVDVGALATEAAGLMLPLIDKRAQTLVVDVPVRAVRVLGDYRRLEQVLLNLLSNANKFAPAGARISVTVRGVTDVQDVESAVDVAGVEGITGGSGDTDDGVLVTVADDGPGIPPEARSRLFEQFYTSRTSSPGQNIGAGLGLPIAKGIVEAHGGRIWVETEVGAGAVFHVFLPIQSLGSVEGGDEDPDC